MAKTRFPLGPRVTVEVKKELLTKAVAADSTRCYVAEAIKAAVPAATHVAVDLSTTRFTDPDKGLRYVYLTPYSVQLALIAFDEGNEPAPFKFVLKNAHVTRAGLSPKAKERHAKDSKKRRRAAALDDALKTTVVRAGDTENAVPRRIGGRRPPQLRLMRKFGVRAFRGASLKRKGTTAAGA